MIRIDLALLADAATVDAAGKLNLLGIFDRVLSASFPAQHGRVALVVRFAADAADAGRHPLAIRFLGPDGEILTIQGDLHLPPPSPRTDERITVPQVFNLDGIVFPTPGRFTFELSVDGRALASIPLEVVHFRPPARDPQLPPFPSGSVIRA